MTEHTCCKCGTTDEVRFVWGEDSYCYPCLKAEDARRKAERRAELDAMPRCEVPNCKRRATLQHGGTLICGRHFNRARANTLARMRTAPPTVWMGPTILSKAALIAAATQEVTR